MASKTPTILLMILLLTATAEAQYGRHNWGGNYAGLMNLVLIVYTLFFLAAVSILYLIFSVNADLCSWIGALAAISLQKDKTRLDRKKTLGYMILASATGTIILATLMNLIRPDTVLNDPLQTAIILTLSILLILLKNLIIHALAYLINMSLGQRIKNLYIQYTLAVLTPYIVIAPLAIVIYLLYLIFIH